MKIKQIESSGSILELKFPTYKGKVTIDCLCGCGSGIALSEKDLLAIMDFIKEAKSAQASS